jgi:Na+-driven multidrug efflux pump
MQSSGVLSCRTGELSRPEKCSQQSRNRRAGFSRVAVSAIASRQHEDANRRPARTAEIDSRTKMLLEQPIAPMILRLAIPNATVMLVQILIGLVEVYFVSRTGVDALAGVAPVFPLVSLVVAVAQGAIGGGVVTTVARALGAGRIGTASEYAWYAVAFGVSLGLATTAAMLALGPNLYGQMGVSGNALEIAVSYSSTIFAGATLIWLFNLLMAVVRGTGNLQVPVIVVCGGALILVPLSPALIFGAFGYQGLGPSGGAVAMLVYYAFGTLAYAAYLWGRFGVLKPSFRLPKLSLGQRLRSSVSAECRPSSRLARI